MHIGILFTYGYSLKTWEQTGSLSREIKYLECLSNKESLKFTLFTYGDEEDLNINIGLDNVEIIPIYSYVKKSKFKSVNLFKSLFIPLFIKKNFLNIDLIKQNQLQGVWVGIILKFITGLPLFTRTGYDVFKFSIHDKKNPIKIFAFYLITQLAIIFSDLYTVASKVEITFLSKKFFLQKIQYRPNWVDCSIKSRSQERYKNKILSVGRLEKQKNYQKFIQLFSNSNFEIVIVGSGSEKNSLINYADKNNVSLNIIDRVSNEKLLDLYEKFTFFVSTSIHEGNPKSLLEAMSKGCIVFVSNIENHLELIKHGKNGFIIEDLNENIINVIEQILKDEEKLKIISNNAKKYVNEFFNLDQLSALEVNDYKKLSLN